MEQASRTSGPSLEGPIGDFFSGPNWRFFSLSPVGDFLPGRHWGFPLRAQLGFFQDPIGDFLSGPSWGFPFKAQLGLFSLGPVGDFPLCPVGDFLSGPSWGFSLWAQLEFISLGSFGDFFLWVQSGISSLRLLGDSNFPGTPGLPSGSIWLLPGPPGLPSGSSLSSLEIQQTSLK